MILGPTIKRVMGISNVRKLTAKTDPFSVRGSIYITYNGDISGQILVAT
jgi:hypothetical protein